MIIGLFVSIKQCSDNSNKYDSEIDALNANVEYFKNKLGTETASKIVFQASNKQLKEMILMKDDSLRKLADEFSKIKSIVVVDTKIVIDSIRVPFGIPIPCDFYKIGSYLTSDFKFDWKLTEKGFDLNDVVIPNEQTIITGFKRNWFLGRQILVTDVTNTNPLIETTNIQTTYVRVPKPFYNTRVFNISIGLIGGMLLSK